jgi:hypothetical protein
MKTSPLVASLALAACALPAPMADTDRLSLAAAESAFAAHSVREDMRTAFLANFADDGMFVRNGWLVSNTYLAGQKAPPIVLDWKPVYTEIAPSGELGLSTGPWKITSKQKPDAPAAYGQYVSVWRREAGRWKVAVDLGIGHPQSAFWDAPLEAVALREASGATGGIAQAEARFAADTRAAGLEAAYRNHAANDLRFYRDGAQPVVGLAAALASPTMRGEAPLWTIERSEMARSADWGYARGSYAAPGAAKPAGWFLHVWRFENGSWRLVMDVTNPAAAT